jgi:radical SAM-linked protein
MRLFQRACVRAGVQIAYSQGFNPHQKMSLVPPRSVGVESDDDLLCLWLKEGQAGIDAEAMKSVLPEGIEIISVKTSEAKNIPEPISARYVMKVQNQKIDDGVRKHITDMLASDKIIVSRRAGEDSRTKPVDVRPFLEAINAETSAEAGASARPRSSLRDDGGEFTVDCKISPAGTIRVDEILGLLQLKTVDLIGPVRRTTVQWKGI